MRGALNRVHHICFICFLFVCFFAQVLTLQVVQHGTREEFACAEHLIGSIIYAVFFVFLVIFFGLGAYIAGGTTACT